MDPTTATRPWSFDPVALGGHECNAWIGYYRRDWLLVLRSLVGMVHAGFGLSWPASLVGAWWVLRANQAWAPYPDNDPQKARESMRRFYRLVARAHQLPIEAAEAARREVAWWHEHRVLQHQHADLEDSGLVTALADLYAYVHARPASVMLDAARDRALAMQISDAWVADGCHPDDDRIRHERHLLVRSYSRLLDVIGPAATRP